MFNETIRSDISTDGPPSGIGLVEPELGEQGGMPYGYRATSPFP